MSRLKEFTLIIVVLILVVALAIPLASAAADTVTTAPRPNVVVSPSAVNLVSGSKIAIMGSGFEAGQQVHLLLRDNNGIVSEVAGALDPAPVANNNGNWGTVFTVGDFSKVASTGVFSVIAADENYTFLTSAPLGFYVAKDPREKWPSWAQVLVPK